LLTQGEHFVDNFLFRCEGFVGCSQEYIGHGSVHRISVTKAMLPRLSKTTSLVCWEKALISLSQLTFLTTVWSVSFAIWS
jgi:hypothetical protein